MIPLLWPATRTRSPSSSKSSSEGWRPPDRAVRGRFKPKDNMTLYKTVFQHSPYRIISANPMDIFSFEPKRAAGLYVDHCQRNIPFLHFLLFFHSSPFSIQIWLTLFILGNLHSRGFLGNWVSQTIVTTTFITMHSTDGMMHLTKKSGLIHL